MIAKRCDLLGAISSSFKRLGDYLMNHQGNENRVGEVRWSNVLSSEFGADVAFAEVQATQDRNTRAKNDKTYHLLFSLPEGEIPTDKALQEIEQKLCEGLGFGGHQRLSVVHRDTDNLHVHVAINKIHPDKLVIIEPYYDKKKLGSLCETLEREYGLQVENHIPKKTVSQANAANMEKAGGMESLLGWLQRECLAEMRAAKTWEALHEVLHTYGVALRERGNGFIITDGKVAVKASSVGREFSKGALEKKLGPFVQAVNKRNPPKKQYKKRPMQAPSSEALWERYKREGGIHKKALDEARYRKARAARNAKTLFGVQRFFLSFINPPSTRMLLRAMFAAACTARITKAKQRYENTKTQIFTRRITWQDWLKSQAAKGDKDALGLLQSRRSDAATGNVYFGTVATESVEKRGFTVTQKGTRVFANGIRETAHEVQMSFTDQGAILDGLKIAQRKFEGPIAVQGDEAFKKRTVQAAVDGRLDIKFQNIGMENERRRFETIKRYIESRNLMRNNVVDILNHRSFKTEDAGEKIFSGIRRYEGLAIALLKDSQDVIVVPVSNEIAHRLKSIAVGSAVHIDATGAIKITEQSKTRRMGR